MPGPSLIGLTGGIAAGKSEVLRIFDELGAATLSTDAVVHELLTGEEVAGLLIERWGEEVAPVGTLDREAIAAVVFGRPEELQWLESELHPRVGARVVEWCEAVPGDFDLAVIEVPLLFEGGMSGMFDATVAVVAADAVRAERASARGTGELEGRSSRQLSQDEKAARATHLIENDGSLDSLRERVTALYEQLAGAAPE